MPLETKTKKNLCWDIVFDQDVSQTLFIYSWESYGKNESYVFDFENLLKMCKLQHRGYFRKKYAM